MMPEREIYLMKNDNDKGNGFYNRKLATPIGNLEISVPRTRTGECRPNILPEPYNRDCAELIKIITIKNQNMYNIQYIVIKTDNQT